MSIIGIILLIGIVKKNAIMMIDFALNAERNEAEYGDSIFEASTLRFRPIMMTTMAAPSELSRSPSAPAWDRNSAGPWGSPSSAA